MVREMPTKREEKPKFPGGRSGRNLRDKPAKASSATAMRGDTHPSTMQLMEAVVERSNGGASFTVKSEAWCLKDDLNRRIRNRTSGGVGGTGLAFASSSYPMEKLRPQGTHSGGFGDLDSPMLIL